MRCAIHLVVLSVGVLGLGLLVPWTVSADPPLFKLDTPSQLMKVSVPHRPNAIVWSPDGAYIATGAWGWWRAGEKASLSEIYVIDVRRESVKTTLKVPSSFPGPGLVFSPDGKWLAIGTPTKAGDETSELAIFDVPAFTRKFTAKPSGAKVGFVDLTWSADGKALYAVEGSDEEKSQVRRWAMPDFTEQPAIRVLNSGRCLALAVSADGKALAVAEYKGLLRLFDLPSGTERTSFLIGGVDLGWRLAFAEDGKEIALFDQGRTFWFDTATGKATKLKLARVAIQPSGLSDQWCSRYAISPDGRKQVRGEERHPTLVFEK
ncbi:MAG TPA: WD40 repeat domain-containing protein, partial [Gemmata sp.]|nr:WD40 repeat domain-containing protein [Gemmata sp.]